nr:histidine kinase [uncultured Roseateles sp.]
MPRAALNEKGHSSPSPLPKLDRWLARFAQPGVVLQVAALTMCLLELAAAVAGLAGYRTEPYDGALAALYLRLGGNSNDPLLLLACFALVLVFAYQYWRLAQDAREDQALPHLLRRIVLVDLLAVAVTPGLPFLVTALAAVLLRARPAFLFALGQVVLNLLLYWLLPLAELQQARAEVPAWLDSVGLLLAMVALHGMALGLGRMAAVEAEKRRWLQVMLAERMSAEQLQAEQMRYSERTLMARELHDVVGHHLTALNLQLQLSSALLQRQDASGAAAAVDRAQSSAAQLLADVREAVSQQRSSQRIDLSSALQALAEGVASTRIELRIAPAARDLGPRLAHALLRCVQEAVTNSVRHARARSIQIELWVDGPLVHVKIADDGLGAPALRPGNGLQGMQERVSELGGTMQIDAKSPGFRIELQVPRSA